MMKTVCALRHVAFEDLGSFASVLAARGYSIRYVEVGTDDLTVLEPLADELWVVLGGPIGVYEAEAYPFIRAELALLQTRLAAGRAVLGICLGCQLMARALGAEVYPGGRKEIGWGPLTLTAVGLNSPLAALADGTPVLHWHGDTFDLPADAVLLASTAAYPHQAFAWGQHALGLQFHLETTARGLERWWIGHACEIAHTAGLRVSDLRAATALHAARAEARGRQCLTAWLDQAGL